MLRVDPRAVPAGSAKMQSNTPDRSASAGRTIEGRGDLHLVLAKPGNDPFLRHSGQRQQGQGQRQPDQDRTAAMLNNSSGVATRS